MGDADDAPPLQVQAPTFERTPSMEMVALQQEDQSAMTIDFLRARLLAERSVSKAARQRARQLASKVSELEQRVESEASMRRKLEEVRREVVSKHKGELMEDCGNLFVDKVSYDDNAASQQESLVHSEHQSDNPEGFASSEDASKGHVSNLHVQDKNGDDDIDQLAREKGILAWASRRVNERLQIKEWAQSPTHLQRSFSPRSFGSVSPNDDSPRKRWIGKSVRQNRTRTFNLNLEGREVNNDQARESLHSDEDKDAVERKLDHQTELQAEEKHFCLEGDINTRKVNSSLGARHEEVEERVLTTSNEQVTKEESGHGKMESSEVDDGIEYHVAKVNGSMNGSENNTRCSAIELADVKFEGNSIGPGLALKNQMNAQHSQESNTQVAAGFNFYASSLSSSQGSNLDGLSYQKRDPLLGYASNHQEPSESMSRDSSERAYRNGSYSFVKSPSLTSESDKPSKLGSYEDRPRRSSYGSSANGNSSYGSSKGLMNASWDEIFKRRILAQGAGNVNGHTNDIHKGMPASYQEKQKGFESAQEPSPYLSNAYEERRDSRSLRTTHYEPYSSPYLSDAYEERRHSRRIHNKSVDTGLDRVMEVLRALQIAKQHVESSNEHMMNEFRYSSQGLPYADGYYPSYSPARRVELFTYDMEDSHEGAYMQRSPLSMQNAWKRGEPKAGEANWRESYRGCRYTYPPYTSMYQ